MPVKMGDSLPLNPFMAIELRGRFVRCSFFQDSLLRGPSSEKKGRNKAGQLAPGKFAFVFHVSHVVRAM